MGEQAIRQQGPITVSETSQDKARELPVGSELMIAFALGAGGWYAIVRVIQWITG